MLKNVKTIKEEITMTEKQIYELTPAQDVPYLQCKYTLFKRVINILSSISLSEDIDFDVMKDAFNLVVERNDCLRIKFFKKYDFPEPDLPITNPLEFW